MLSKKDKQILKHLDINSRQSIAQISKKSHINKETVNYTIKKLENQGIIQGYFSLINYFKLDSHIFKLLVKYYIGGKDEKKIIDWLKKRDEVIWIGKTEGKWDLIISIREKSLEKIYDFLKQFNRLFSKSLQEKQLLICYEMEWLSEKHLYPNKKERYKVIFNKEDKKEQIDKKDELIVYELEHNSKIPTINIASKIKLTAEAIAKRINNLIKKRIIAHFKLRVNLEKLEKGYHHIFISLKDFSKIQEITSYYENSESCTFIMKYFGNYDLHVELVSNSQNEFRTLITEFREKFGNLISEYQQLTILEEHKLA